MHTPLYLSLTLMGSLITKRKYYVVFSNLVT